MRHQSQKGQPHNIVIQTMCEDGEKQSSQCYITMLWCTIVLSNRGSQGVITHGALKH